jgi:hypothetical protein
VSLHRAMHGKKGCSGHLEVLSACCQDLLSACSLGLCVLCVIFRCARSLGTVFNEQRRGASKFAVLKRLVMFAAESGQLDFVRPYLGLVPVWCRSWGVAEVDTRALLKQVADTLAAAGDRCVRTTPRGLGLHVPASPPSPPPSPYIPLCVTIVQAFPVSTSVCGLCFVPGCLCADWFLDTVQSCVCAWPVGGSETSHGVLVELLDAYELDGAAASPEAADVAASLVAGAVALPIVVSRSALGKLASVCFPARSACLWPWCRGGSVW